MADIATIDMDKEVKPTEQEEKLVQFVMDRYDKAAMARTNYGIETKWADAKAAFDGDYQKEKGTDGEQDRSRIYVQITRSKCVSALSSVISNIFQSGKLPYAIEPSPVPDSINGYLEFLGIDITKNLENMKLKMDDQIQEANVKKSVIMAILELVVYGTCLIRVPVTRQFTRTSYDVEAPIELPTIEEIQEVEDPEQQARLISQIRAVIENAGEFIMKKFIEEGPGVEVLSIWDAFPDPDAQTSDVQDMDYFIYRNNTTKLQLLNMAKDGIYPSDKINAIIRSEGDGMTTRSKNNDPDIDQATSEANYTLYRYSGALSIKDLRDFLDPGDSEKIKDKLDDEVVEALITVSGEYVLEASLALDRDGVRQYQMCPYEAVPRSPWGRGVPINVRDVQSLINGLTRSLVEAKKMSSSVQAVMNPGSFEVGETGAMYPRKVWKVNKGVRDVREVMHFFTVPDNSAGTLQAIELFKSMGDEHSSIPRVLEGQFGGTSRQTAFEVNQVVSAANLQLENVIRNVDEYLISRIALGFYVWNMEIGTDPSVKGDFKVISNGFQAFKDRVDKSQKIDIMMSSYGQDPELRSFLKVEDIFRQRLELDGLQQFMWSPDEIQAQREAAQQQAQLEHERQVELAQAVQHQKFEDAVLKKGEVQATKEAIQEERDKDEAIEAQRVQQDTRDLVTAGRPVDSNIDQIADQIDEILKGTGKDGAKEK